MQGSGAGPSVLRTRLPRIEEESDSDSGAYMDAASGREKEDSEEEYEEDAGEEEDEIAESQDYERDSKGKGVASPERRQRFENDFSSKSEKADSSRSWSDLDLSMVVALVSPVGNWLTGSDHVKNLFLLLLLIFYLHQLIEVPWQLYHNSRPRAKHAGTDVAVRLAMSELRTMELFYLSFTVVAPFLGAILIRYVFSAMEGVDSLSWFSTALFVLATGIRPWSHLISRLHRRTQDLHNSIHKHNNREHEMEVDEKLRAVVKRLDSLERDLHGMKSKTEKILPLQEVCEDINEALDIVERNVHRNERKTESARLAHNTRLAAIEAMLVHLEERQKLQTMVPSRTDIRRRGLAIPVPPVLARLFSPVYGQLLRVKSALRFYFPRLFRKRSKQRKGAPSSPPVHVDIPLSDTQYFNGTPLQTIPEAADSDSEGTYYVPDKDASPPAPKSETAEKRTAKKLQRGRTRSLSGSRPPRRPKSYGQKAVDLAATVVSWPYHFAVRILLSALPVQIRKLLV